MDNFEKERINFINEAVDNPSSKPRDRKKEKGYPRTKEQMKPILGPYVYERIDGLVCEVKENYDSKGEMLVELNDDQEIILDIRQGGVTIDQNNFRYGKKGKNKIPFSSIRKIYAY